MDTKHWTSSASTMEPLSSFVSLPNEIVTQICEHPDLNKDDLIALRLTSKAHGVHDAATKALGRYFRDITVLFTRHSFQTLVDVCEHPVFGRSVRRIMLFSIRCGRDNIHHKRVINALLEKTHPYGYNDGYPEDLRRYKATNSATWLKTLHDVSVRIQSYNSRAQNEDVFAKSGDSLVLLVQAFQSLARLDSSTTVGLTNQECHGLDRDQSFCAGETNNEDELWFNALGDTADMIATALLESGLLVTEFNIETCLNLKLRVPVTGEILKTQEVTTNAMFSRLKEMRLEVNEFTACLDMFDAPALSAMLARSTQLRSLRLGSREPPRNWMSFYTSTFLRSISSSYLETLHLYQLKLTESSLGQLLDKACKLKRLSMLNCIMLETHGFRQ
ncbi:hypothetical protein D6C84_04357 [Aureobasidium pullulans]|uniref:F-box domain-containing protein n=1 Tax=Aureobasidium pullulans TaxID=5580 RepID=A0A4S9XWC3_AURPU|nr:hypothetical protein D6C84_04357 [Aureobasidium pullulans]